MLKILHLFNQLSYQCLLQSLVFLPPQGDYKNCGSEQCLEKGDQELAKNKLLLYKVLLENNNLCQLKNILFPVSVGYGCEPPLAST